MATALAVALTMIGCLVVMAQAMERFPLSPATPMFLLPAAGLFGLLKLLSGPPYLQLAIGGFLTVAALISLWRLPGVAAYRAEQAELSRLALLGSPGAVESTCAHG